MPRAHANGIEIEYETIGNPDHPTILLIMGLGAQLTHWDRGFAELLAGRGFQVIRFDNRDVGLSTKIDAAPPDWPAIRASGQVPQAPYTLSDMAADAIGLLDALGIATAHVVGASLGGFIAQTLAIEHPGRVTTLCSIMSSTGDPSVGRGSKEARALLYLPAPKSREEVIERALESLRVYGSKGLAIDWEHARRRAELNYDRCHCPEGRARQMLASMKSGDRTEKLRALDLPTLVIHGTDDALIDPSGGSATAAAIAGARLLLVQGMGHDMPKAAWAEIVDAIVDNVARARRN
jgi:pimeloyl-ACP methyl ester carboxylesterase